MRLREKSATPTGSWVQLWGGQRQNLGLFILFFSVICSLFIIFLSPSAAAVQTVPYKINFQGYLRDSSNQTLADGDYNMTFRLYDATENGTVMWTGIRQETTRVAVVNGYFSVQLGDTSPLSPTLFDGSDLYLEIELPTPATATCATNGCANYSEGPMTPRQRIASAAYAINADQLDGYDASEFAIGAGNNMFTGMNTFRTDNSAAFAIQNANSDSLLVANTSTMQVTIGSATNGVRLSMDGIELSGTARGLRTIALSPEYPGATFLGDGTANNGNLTSDFCSNSGALAVNSSLCPVSGDVASYYQWATDQMTPQDYDIYVRYRMPADYSTGSMQDLFIKGFTASTSSSLSMTMYDSAGTQVATTGTVGNDPLDVNYWSLYMATIANTTAVTASEYVTFKIHLSAVESGQVRIGDISFDYRSTF